MADLLAALALVFLLPIGAAGSVICLLLWIDRRRTRKYDDFTGDQIDKQEFDG